MSKMIVISEPKYWEITDDKTGNFKSGFSAICYFPLEGFVMKIPNLPSDVLLNCSYDVELGYKQAQDKNGKFIGVVEFKEIKKKSKDLDWSKIL